MNKNILISALVFLVVLAGGYLLVAPNDQSGNGTSGSDSGSDSAGNGGSQSTAKPGSDSSSNAGGNPDKEKDDLVAGESGLSGVRYVEIETETQVSSSEQAQAVVDQQSAALGIELPAVLEVVDNTEDGLGNSYYQIDQFYEDIPVYGASALLEVQNNRADVLSGVWEDNIELNPEPTYSAEEALGMAAESLGSTQEPSLQILGQPALVVYVSNLGAHLAWHMKARVFEGREYEELIVDAHDPDFLLRVSLGLH